MESLDEKNERSESNFYIMHSRIRENPQLSVTECGWEICGNYHSFGPVYRDYYLLHFVVDGAGVLNVDGRDYAVSKNQFFLLTPQNFTSYHADHETPWTYYWVGFEGLEAAKLLNQSGFIKNDAFCRPVNDPQAVTAVMREINECARKDPNGRYTLLGLLYRLFGLLIPSEKALKKEKEDYIDTAVNYINHNFNKDISVSDISGFLGLERSYFYRLFKSSMKLSPMEYLLNIRLSYAYNLLINTSKPFAEIADAAGFDDYSHFSKMFKKHFASSPRLVRQREKEPPTAE